jgi:hypothetical protein
MTLLCHPQVTLFEVTSPFARHHLYAPLLHHFARVRDERYEAEPMRVPRWGGVKAYSDETVANRNGRISGGRALTGPFRDASRFPSTRG